MVGPTAAGKTRMAVEVALEVGDTEIVSCDSMGVYRYLDIAADKPSLDARGGIPHHGFDLADPNEDFTVVRYRDWARDKIREIQDRHKLPLLVGGSGLWFRAVVDELTFAPTDPELRRSIEREDPLKLWEEITAADPEIVRRVDPRNTRRVVRAVEILRLTGSAPTDLRGEWEYSTDGYELAVCGITWDRETLRRRADERVDTELAAGMLAEVRGVNAEHGISPTAQQALGVKELLDPAADLVQSIERLKSNTRNYIRKQVNWFGADPRVEWFNADEIGWDACRDGIAARFRGLR